MKSLVVEAPWVSLVEAGEYGLNTNGIELAKFISGKGIVVYPFPLVDVLHALAEEPLFFPTDIEVENVRLEFTFDYLNHRVIVEVKVSSTEPEVEDCQFGWPMETLKANLERVFQELLSNSKED